MNHKQIFGSFLLIAGFVSCAKSGPQIPAAQDLNTASQVSDSGFFSRGFFSRIFSESRPKFSESGSLVLSFQLPPQDEHSGNGPLNLSCDLEGPQSTTEKGAKFAPIIGYFPPKLSKLPAENEIWMEIDKKEGHLKVYHGKQLVSDVSVEGTNNIPSGEYLVQSKQNSPRWYAEDSYFRSRGLNLPEKFAESRFLKGALGPKAMFLSDKIALHSSPIWTQEVGGIKIEKNALASIYEQSTLGVSVVVR